jgi:hypothetical protein
MFQSIHSLLRCGLYILFLSLLNTVKLSGQNTSSPYSILGIGDIEDSHFNRTSGMANTGIAYRNGKELIINNPAALSDMQQQFFHVEVFSRAKFVNYSSKNIAQNSYGNYVNTEQDFSIERLSIGTKINKWWGTALGIMPFSTSNYSFSGTKNLQGSNITMPTEYEGSGGVNRFYFANGLAVTKNLSAGITASYLGGSLKQTESLISQDLTTELYTAKNIYLRNWYLEYGMQFYTPITKQWNLVAGATYAQNKKLSAEYSVMVTDANDDTLSNKVTKNGFFSLPAITGFGIALIKNKKISFLADYKFEKWTSLNISGSNYSLVNSKKYSAGFDYSKQNKFRNISYEAFNVQAGAFYNLSYLKINNEQLIDAGFTLGAGFNSKRSTLSYSFAFQYGNKGSKHSVVKEKYSTLTIGLSYKDFWYTKGKKYD